MTKSACVSLWFGALSLVLLTACGSSQSATPDGVAADAVEVSDTVEASDLQAELIDSEVTGTDSTEDVHVDAIDDEALSGPARTPGGLPLALPFPLTRNDDSAPIPDEEVEAFTQALTGSWKEIDYFVWLSEITHGSDVSTGKPDYLIWWHDVSAIKENGKITWMNDSQEGGSHNNVEPTGLALVSAASGYLLSGREDMGFITEQFAKSINATLLGFVYDEDDPIETIMARNIITQNQSYTLASGKEKNVEYDDWFFEYEGWNAERFHYPNNPYWGDIWVTTMRSKDDVHYLYRATGWLLYVAELGQTEAVRKAASDAVAGMRGFARDIVDHDYNIRSKDRNGVPHIPEAEDLASLSSYTSVFPMAECDARLSTALLAYGEPLGVDCKTGQGSPYDDIACTTHYFNYHIVWGFHMVALQWALILGYDAEAWTLLKGLITRIERYMNPSSQEPGQEDPSWKRDMATLLVQAASLGMPLRNDEVRLIHEVHLAAVAQFADFENWDMWADSVPDGRYTFRSGFQPQHNPESTRIEDYLLLLEYCWSPFRNPAGAPIVDCDVISNPALWGGTL